ncbi:MAG: 50S ribosomal protein L25 [Minisyncoccia bacterium]
MNSLVAEKRTETGKRTRALVSAGKMAAVVYGPKQEATSISLSQSDFVRVLKSAGESSVIELSGVGSGKLQVLIHDIDHDPVTNVPRHVDLYAIEKGAKVEVAVPIEFINESPAVKAGANLVKVMHEVEIEAEAADLPHDIQVDISVLLNIGDQIHAKDLKLPKGVTLKVEDDEVVALIQEVEEEVEEAPVAIDMDAIEVEKKGKEEESSEGESKE